MATEILVVSLGGLVVGLLAGYTVYRVMYNLDEHMTETVLSLLLAYGAFLLAEHYLHVSGVIATVVAGLFIGAHGADEAMSPQTKISVFNTLETGAFLANTFIFLMIGITTPIGDLLRYADLIAVAIPLVLLSRATGLYPVIAVVNRISSSDISLDYQHVMVWSGLHASIPIALVLGLPPELDAVLRQRLRALVFAVAAFSLLVQGLSMKRLLDRLGVVTTSEAQELYELLLARRRAVDGALDAAEDLKQRGDIPGGVYEDFTTEYESERDDLGEAINELLREHPEIRQEQKLAGERRLLKQEKSAIMDAIHEGIVSDAAGERLLEEVNIKLDRVRSGETTVEADEEGYHEFWRDEAADFGLESVEYPEEEREESGE
ncbi:cation:proton antiporter [Halospeciosus flavus]|uniref:cation:proton antiporter n=1 Tax=Halospeciosus flavus TaxID=3032283 RepID=UPI00360D809E